MCDQTSVCVDVYKCCSFPVSSFSYFRLVFFRNLLLFKTWVTVRLDFLRFLVDVTLFLFLPVCLTCLTRLSVSYLLVVVVGRLARDQNVDLFFRFWIHSTQRWPKMDRSSAACGINTKSTSNWMLIAHRRQSRRASTVISPSSHGNSTVKRYLSTTWSVDTVNIFKEIPLPLTSDRLTSMMMMELFERQLANQIYCLRPIYL